MAASVESIEGKALSLPREEHPRLIVHLLASIEERPGDDASEVERAWLAEAQRRYEAHRRGEVENISTRDVFPDLCDDGDWMCK